jgi:hypothetical protein
VAVFDRSRLGLAVLVALVLATSCKSAKQREYERAAKQLNPIITVLQATSQWVMAIKGDDATAHVQIISACLNHPSAVRDLAYVRADIQGMDAVRNDAEHLRDGRFSVCKREVVRRQLSEDPGDERRVADCARFCRESWQRLADDIEQLRTGAADEGVDIVSLMH